MLIINTWRKERRIENTKNTKTRLLVIIFFSISSLFVIVTLCWTSLLSCVLKTGTFPYPYPWTGGHPWKLLSLSLPYFYNTNHWKGLNGKLQASSVLPLVMCHVHYDYHGFSICIVRGRERERKGFISFSWSLSFYTSSKLHVNGREVIEMDGKKKNTFNRRFLFQQQKRKRREKKEELKA